MAKPNWEAIEQEYRSGQLSIRAIADKYGVNEKTIRNRIKSAGWVISDSPQKVRSADNVENQSQTGINADLTSNQSAAKPQENESILKAQWEQFAVNISQGMTQKDAAVCAGYSPRSAESQASILLRQPAIKARIKELRADSALLASFNARDLADLSFNAAKEAAAAKQFGQVAPNVKNAAQLIGVEMGASKTAVDVNLAGLSYGKVCIVTPANCDATIWAAHMDRLREGKQTARS